MKIRIFLIIILLIGCSKEPVNQELYLNISNTADGLEITLKGSAIDPDGEITEVKINWGDNKIGYVTDDDFSKIEVKHTYNEPGDYDLIITARNIKNDSTYQKIYINIDFKETSLNNIKPKLFKTSDKDFLILTLNLHTYQESQQNEKFQIIADVIGKMDIDFIAFQFQECAQNKSSDIYEGIIREDNMALIISNIIKEKYSTDYNFVWNWAHYGWNVWEEGIAILSKFPISDTDERYISSYTGTTNIISRKVIYGSYQMPTSKINIFSTHTHWRTSVTDEEHNNQIMNIKLMVDEKEDLILDAFTFVCGDFNVNPTSEYPWSEGYNTMMENDGYLDTFFEIYPDANNKPAQSKYHTIGGTYPGRIDYIFMKENTRYEVLESQIIFTEDIVGEVSDHFGVITKILDKQ